MQICRNCFNEYEGTEDACYFCGYAQSSDKREVHHLPVGTLLYGKYVIGRVLGSNGFCNTYKAWDNKIERYVSIKEYYPGGLVNRIPDSKEVIVYNQKHSERYLHGKEWLLESAQNMAKFIDAPNLLDVYDSFEENNTAYVVSEMFEGITLKKYLAKSEFGRLDYKVSCKIILQVAEALKALHEKGIIHRDVNPGNIIICNVGGKEVVKLLIDFGMARFSKDKEVLFDVMMIPGYAPIEQYIKKDVAGKMMQGPWTDVYALGATMYHLLTGIRPEESINRKIKDTVLYPHKIDSAIPTKLSKAIMKAMAVDIRKRYKKVEDFVKKGYTLSF